MFSDLNRTARKTSKSLDILYNHRDLLSQVALTACERSDLFRRFVGLGVLLLEAIELGFERMASRNFFVGEIDGMSVEPAQASRVAIWKVRSD